jgi:hypothetical protein
MRELTESFKLYRGAVMTPDVPEKPELLWDDVQATAGFFLSGEERKHRTWLRVHCPPAFKAADNKLLVMLTMKPGPLGVYAYNDIEKEWQEPVADSKRGIWRMNESSVNGLLNKNSRSITNYENILVLNTTAHIWPGAMGLGNAMHMCACYRNPEWHDELLDRTKQALRDELVALKDAGGTEFDFAVATGPFEPRNGGRERINQYTAIMDELVGKNNVPDELGLKMNMRAVKLNAGKKIPGSELRIVAAVHPNAALFKLPVHAEEVCGVDEKGKELRTYTLVK